MTDSCGRDGANYGGFPSKLILKIYLSPLEKTNDALVTSTVIFQF